MRRGPGVPDGKPVRSVRAVQPRHGHASDGDGDGVDAVRGCEVDDAVSSRRDARAVRAVRDGEREPAGGGEREAHGSMRDPFDLFALAARRSASGRDMAYARCDGCRSMLAYAAGSTAVRCAACLDGDGRILSETPAAAAASVETRGERESRGRDLRART